MRYSLRKLRRKVKRLEDRPMPGGKVNDVIRRYAETGELPKSDRLLRRVSDRATLLAELQVATCVPDHREAEVMRAVARHFTPPRDASEAAGREALERVAVMLSRNVDPDDIDRRVRSWVKGNVPLDTLRAARAVALPLAFLIRTGVVRVASERYICNDGAGGDSVAAF